MKTLEEILNQRNLSALFQPVMDLTNGTFLGFEGLIRGPVNSPLHSPINLFAAAKQQGLSLKVEMLCRQIVLKSFAAQNLPGNLFLNVSPVALTHPSFKNGQTLAYLENLGHVAASVYRKLHRIYGAPAEYSVFPRNPLPLHALNQYLEAPIPPLIKGYLRLGALTSAANRHGILNSIPPTCSSCCRYRA